MTMGKYLDRKRIRGDRLQRRAQSEREMAIAAQLADIEAEKRELLIEKDLAADTAPPAAVEVVAEPEPAPEEKAAPDEKCGPMGEVYMPYGGATTMADAMAAMMAEEQAGEIRHHVGIFQDVVRNISNSPTVDDKADAIASAARELSGMMASDAGKMEDGEGMEPEEAALPEIPEESEIEEIAGGDKSIASRMVEWLKVKMTSASVNDLPDSAFAYVEPGGKKDEGGKTAPRSLRHYPIHDAAHVRNALARASQAKKKGGKTAQIAARAMPKIEAMARKMKIGGSTGSPTGKELDSSFAVYKDAEGRAYWIGIVTNKYRDRDTRHHPKGEIITSEAHKEFMNYLDAHPDKAPELWTWHTPGTARKSRADWWDFDGAFVVMSGPLTDEEAKAFEDGEQLGMSHGFFALARDADNSLITKYRTFEASELNPNFSANEWTDFATVRKELTMAFTSEKRALLVKRFGEEKVRELEGKTGDVAKALDALGVEWKADDTPPADAPKEDKPAAPDDSEIVKHVLEALNVAELKSGLTMLNERAALVPGLEAKIESLTKQMAELKKSDDQKIAEAMTPRNLPVFSWGFDPMRSPSTKADDNNPNHKDLKKSVPNDSWVSGIAPLAD